MDMNLALEMATERVKLVRTGSEEIIVFDAIGLSVQDLTLPHAIYRQARERGLGEVKDFLRCRLQMEPIET